MNLHLTTKNLISLGSVIATVGFAIVAQQYEIKNLRREYRSAVEANKILVEITNEAIAAAPGKHISLSSDLAYKAEAYQIMRFNNM